MSQSLANSDSVIATSRDHDINGNAVIGTDAAGKILYWNESAEALYGWSPSLAIGKNVLEVTATASSIEESAHIMKHLRAGRDWTGDFAVRRRDGTPIVVHVTTKPVLEGDTVVGVVGVSYLDRRRTPGSMRAIVD